MEDPGKLPICPLGVQPLSAEEDGGDAAGCVSDLYTVKQPAGTQATVVVFYTHLQQLPHIQHLQQEAVCLLALEKVAELLPQLPTARVTIGTINGEKDVGVSTRPLLIAGDNDDLVLDGHQAAGLAGEALHGLCTLEGQEFVPLWRKGDLGIANEDVPADRNSTEVRAEIINNQMGILLL